MGLIPLPSWNDGPVKKAIIDFVTSSTSEGSSNFIPESDRIAAFDNDGTLWVEQPVPVQMDFFFRTWNDEIKENPSLAGTQPYKAVVEQDHAFFEQVLVQQPDAVTSILEAVSKSWEGLTPEEFDADVKQFFATVKHEKFGVPFTDLVYTPMLELFELLNVHDYRIYVCSGGGRDFMRVISEETWGILKENVIGSAPEVEYKDGKFQRQATVLGRLDLGPGKPEHIFARTGRVAAFASGNGDVDIEMLEAAKFALLIVHDDAEREFVYTSGAEQAIAEGKSQGWALASIKNDWKTVFSKSQAT